MSSKGIKASDLREIKVLKQSGHLDLVELEVPDAIDKRICPGISPHVAAERSGRPAGALSVAAIGYIRSIPSARFSRDIDWETGAFGFSELAMTSTSLDVNSVLLEIKDLRVVPGLSGGLTVSSSGEALGITSRLVPYQISGFIVPMTVVDEFLANPNQRDATRPDMELKRSNPAGENTHIGGGENTHIGGGSPSGSSLSKSGLAQFREPDEGVPDPESSGQILLGLIGPDGFSQIDGMDDYRIRYLGGKSKRKISRPVSGYLDAPILKELPKRLSGRFHPTFDFRGTSSADHKIFLESAGDSMGWSPLASGGDAWLSLDLDSLKNTLILQTTAHFLYPTSNPYEGIPVTAEVLLFRIKVSADARTISLEQEESGKTLTCDNRNFLKLVCSSDSMELSLSLLRQDMGRKRPLKILSYRLTRWLTTQTDEPKLIDYRYGTVAEVE